MGWFVLRAGPAAAPLQLSFRPAGGGIIIGRLKGAAFESKLTLFLSNVLDGLETDDILIINELSRIGRSMLDCMEILAIAAKREIRVYAIKGNWHLDETIQSKIMAMVFSMAAEIERGLISARTKEALRARRAKGPGKSKLDKHRPEIEALFANGSTQKFIPKRYNSSPANLANWLKKRGVKKPKPLGPLLGYTHDSALIEQALHTGQETKTCSIPMLLSIRLCR